MTVQKVFSLWSEEVLRRSSSFWKDSARDKFLRESRHLYGGQVRERRGQCETEPRENIKHVEKALATLLESAMSVEDTCLSYESERERERG